MSQTITPVAESDCSMPMLESRRTAPVPMHVQPVPVLVGAAGVAPLVVAGGDVVTVDDLVLLSGVER